MLQRPKFNKRAFKKWLRKLDPWNKYNWYHSSSRLRNYFTVEPSRPTAQPPWLRPNG